MKKASLIVFTAVLLLWGAVGSKQDFTLGTSSGNPSSGKVRLWANTATGNLECLNSAGTTCFPASGGDCTDSLIAGALSSGSFNAAGHVYCLSGAYTTTTSQTISSNDVTVRCAPNTSLTQQTADTSLFVISGDKVTISGCILDGKIGTVTQVNTSAARITGNFATVERCTVQNWGTSTDNGWIHVTAGNGARVLRNSFISSTAGWDFYAESSGADITNIELSDNYMEVGGGGYGAYWKKVVAHDMRSVLATRNNIQGTGFCMRGGADSISNGIHGLRWVGNNCLNTGTTGYAGFAIYSVRGSTVANNTFDDGGNFRANEPAFAFHDAYESTLTGNAVTYTGSGNPVCYYALDSGRNALVGNTCFGATPDASTRAAFWLETAAGSAHTDDNVISSNVIQLAASSAGPAFLLRCNSASSTCSRNAFVGNHVLGDGTAGQIGISLLLSTGTATADNFVSNNHIASVPTGIATGSGVTNTKLASHDFVSVTTQVSDSGTGTFGETHISRGTCVLGTSCAVTLPQGGFSASTSYQCTATDTTSAAATKVVNTSATVATFTGTGTDTLAYHCAGF